MILCPVATAADFSVSQRECGNFNNRKKEAEMNFNIAVSPFLNVLLCREEEK